MLPDMPTTAAEIRPADDILLAQSAGVDCRVGRRGFSVSYDPYNDTFYMSARGLGNRFALTGSGGRYLSSGGRVVILTDSVRSGTWPFSISIDGIEVAWGECRLGRSNFSDSYRDDENYQIPDPYSPAPRRRRPKQTTPRNYYFYRPEAVHSTPWSPKRGFKISPKNVINFNPEDLNANPWSPNSN